MNDDAERVIEEATIQTLRGLFEDEKEGQTFLNELIDIYRTSGTETVAELNQTFEKGDLEALSRQAHKLKGLSRNIGALRLGNLCAELEFEAKTKSASVQSTAASLCRELAREFATSCEALTKIYFRAS